MVDILMPQMGESIAEGTVTKWLKNVGDSVQRDEPLLEISTDKVDAEIPSPAAGILREIRVAAGNTVAVNSVIGVIADAVAPTVSAPQAAAAPSPAVAPPSAAPAPAAPTPAAATPAPGPRPAAEPEPARGEMSVDD